MFLCDTKPLKILHILKTYKEKTNYTHGTTKRTKYNGKLDDSQW
jgi:hypothetical protein